MQLLNIKNKKNMKKIISITTVLFLLIFILNINLNAQVKTKVFYSNIPVEYKTLMQKTGTTQIIEAPQNFYDLKNSKSSDEEIKFAFDVKKNIDFMKEAILENKNGILKYYLTLNAKDALNTSLQFSNFKLSKNSVLSLYTKNEFTDSITSKENNENNIWATRVYQGNTLTIVLKIPILERENSQLVISTINFGYKNFGTSFDFGNIGASATCEINANCPIGNSWGNEKNSVAMIVADGIVSCTGALIMNSCGNNTPYFLTANHCLNSGNVPNWVF